MFYVKAGQTIDLSHHEQYGENMQAFYWEYAVVDIEQPYIYALSAENIVLCKLKMAGSGYMNGSFVETVDGVEYSYSMSGCAESFFVFCTITDGDKICHYSFWVNGDEVSGIMYSGGSAGHYFDYYVDADEGEYILIGSKQVRFPGSYSAAQFALYKLQGIDYTNITINYGEALPLPK